MDFIERDLEDVIFNAPAIELRKRGLCSYWHNAHTYRQLTIGNYGIADIVQYKRHSEPSSEFGHEFIDNYLRFNVIELKKNIINIDTFLQAIGYCKGILSFIESRNSFEIKTQFTITLVGKKVDTSNFIYLPDIINGGYFDVRMFTYEYSYDGIKFTEQEGYSLTNNKFNKKLPYSKHIKTEPYEFTKQVTSNIEF